MQATGPKVWWGTSVPCLDSAPKSDFWALNCGMLLPNLNRDPVDLKTLPEPFADPIIAGVDSNTDLTHLGSNQNPVRFQEEMDSKEPQKAFIRLNST